MNAKRKSGLLCTILLGSLFVAPSVGFGEETNSYVSDGIIQYKQEEIPDVIITPPTKEEPEIDQPKPNETKGLLMIMGATPVDFGINEATNAQKEYYAANFSTFETATPENAVTSEHFVKFRDLRAVEKHNYTITAQMTKQFTIRNADGTDGPVLKGAKLDYSNLRLETTDANALAGNKPSVVAADNEATLATAIGLAPDNDGVSAGSQVQVLDVHADSNKGFGVFDIVFGTLGATEENLKSERSVKLTVPANLAIVAGKQYKADITWTIAEIPLAS